jgi:hypothetical protein
VPGIGEAARSAWLVGFVLCRATVPFKSRAQRRKFAELLLQGKISNETFEEWNRETGSAKLPERVTHKAKTRPKAKSKKKKVTNKAKRRSTKKA